MTSFTSRVVTTGMDGPRAVVIADVDEDACPDVLVGAFFGKQVAWYRSNCGHPPVFTLMTTLTTTANGVEAVAVGRLNGDRVLDVLSSSYIDNKLMLFLGVACPRGWYGPTGTAPCTPCAAGSWGGVAGLGAEAGASCTGACVAGYTSPAGSPSCSPCPAGLFAEVPGSAVCSMCAGGRFGATAGMAAATCSGACRPGFACPRGSTNSSALACQPGTFSTGAAEVCSRCSAGLYGSSASLETPACTGVCQVRLRATGRVSLSLCPLCPLCHSVSSSLRLVVSLHSLHLSALTSPVLTLCAQAGYFCPAGSTAAAAVACPAGSACPPGSDVPVTCGPGQYSLHTSSQCSLCPAGTWGGDAGLTSPACSGLCAPGWMCNPGSTNDTASPCGLGSFCTSGTSGPLPCPPGVVGVSPHLGTSGCSGRCPAGYYCSGGTVDPLPCGNATVYCPVGVAAPVPVEPGFYSDVGVGAPMNASIMSRAVECPVGYWCASGTRTPCGPGRYVGSTKSRSPADCLVCPAGMLCGTSVQAAARSA